MKTRKEKNNDRAKAYYQANKEKIQAYRLTNKEKISEYNKDYIKNNIEDIKLKRHINKPKRNEQLKKKRNFTPKEKKVKVPKEKKTAKEIAEHRNARNRERKTTEPLFKLKTNIRQLIRSTIQNKGYKKSLKSEQILSCTFEQFKLHLESQFEPWMNWDNYGNPKDKIFAPNKTWDIDHIIPINKALTEEDVVRLNHYTNLQPLCSYVNRFVKRAN